MDNNLDDFNNFIYACENILDNAELDIIKWEPDFKKELWEKRSFLANGEMKTAAKVWDKDEVYTNEKAHKSKSHIEHLVYSNGNNYIVLINKKLLEFKERIENFKTKHNMLNANVIPKNMWFLELYALFTDYNRWFNDLITPLGIILPINKEHQAKEIAEPTQTKSENTFQNETKDNKLHNNIFIDNGFNVWKKMYDDFKVNEQSRTDAKFMLEIMKRDLMIHKSVSQKSYLDWINENFDIDIFKTSNIDLKHIKRLSIYNNAKSMFIKQDI